jgi:hypothetical protein
MNLIKKEDTNSCPLFLLNRENDILKYKMVLLAKKGVK